MSESVAPPVVDPAQGPDATTETDATDWKAEAKKWEQRSKANATAAKKLEQFEEAQKSAEQKAAERESAANQRAAEAEARAARREVALDFKLSKDDAALLDAVADEDAMRVLAKRLAKAAEDERKPANYVPNEGTNPTPPSDDRRAFVRKLTGRE